MKIEKLLEQYLELHPTEIKIYVTLLKYGSMAASTVSLRTNVDRTTTYSALQRLLKKGYVVKTLHQKCNQFQALDPVVLQNQIETHIEQKKIELQAVNQMIPELRKMKESGHSRPEVELFEGPQGIITLYEMMLIPDTQQDAFLTIDQLPLSLRPYLTKEYIRHKKKKRVSSRVLVQESKRAYAYQMLDTKSNRITKILPKNEFPFETEIILGSNHEVAIIDFNTDLVGLFIQSRTLNNTMKALFSSLWAAAL